MKEYHHSPHLFFDGEKPMLFSMRPCAERETLKPVVEHGGATITSKSTPDTIRLVPPGILVRTDNCISSRWIWDCVEQNRKIPMTDYVVKEVVGSDISDFEDVDISRKSPKVTRPSKRKLARTRREYLLCNDLAILNYLYENRNSRLAKVKGRSMWQIMAKEEICKDRSWQSLKERFNKQIFENINSYNLPKEKSDYFKRMKEKKSVGVGASPSASEVSLNKKQTRLYSTDEDIKLIYSVLDEDEFKSISGNTFWKKLEAKKIINRTWQSMKERFLKYIIHDIKEYKIEKEYKECLGRLLRHRSIDYESSTDGDEQSTETEEENELWAETPEECGVEAGSESESSDFELRMEGSEESRAEDVIENAILGDSQSLEIKNSPYAAEISAENTFKTNGNENLVVLDLGPDEFGIAKLQIAFYATEERSPRLQINPDVDLEEMIAKCVKSIEKEESDLDEDGMEVCEEQFANNVQNLMHLALLEKFGNAAIQNQSDDELIVKNEDSSKKRKCSTETEADSKRKRFSESPASEKIDSFDVG